MRGSVRAKEVAVRCKINRERSVQLPRAALLLTMGEEDDALGCALELMEAVVQL